MPRQRIVSIILFICWLGSFLGWVVYSESREDAVTTPLGLALIIAFVLFGASLGSTSALYKRWRDALTRRR